METAHVLNRRVCSTIRFSSEYDYSTTENVWRQCRAIEPALAHTHTQCVEMVPVRSTKETRRRQTAEVTNQRNVPPASATVQCSQ